MTLKEILRELAGRVNAPHLLELIDALPDPPEPKQAKPKGDT